MKRIDNSTATVTDQFTDGDPSVPTPATTVDSVWLNNVQEEIANVIEENGDTLDQSGATTDQLKDAILGLITSSIPSVTLPKNYITGLNTEADSSDAEHDILISPGECRDSADSLDMGLGADIIKQIDSNWSAGSNAGGFPSGLTLSSDTWYHLFLISDGTNIDAGYDTSLTATNLLADAAGYTHYRRIGSILTDGSSNIVNYNQKGDVFRFNAPENSIDTTTMPAGSRTLFTVSTPLGISTNAILRATLNDADSNAVLITSPDEDDIAPSTTISGNYSAHLWDSGGGDVPTIETIVPTNSSAQIGLRGTNTTVAQFVLDTVGYYDSRGK